MPPPLFSLGKHALELWVAHRVMRDTSMKAALAELGKIADAYTILLELVAASASRVMGRFMEVDVGASKKEAIFAGYIAGLTLVEDAILYGYSAQAAALVRQELEAVAALEELCRGTRKDGCTPNVKHVTSVPGSIYGQLSRIAHFSDDKQLQHLASCQQLPADAPENSVAWLLSPQHIPGVTKRLFGLHTLLLLHFFEHQVAYYVEQHSVGVTEDEQAQFAHAVELLRAADII